MEEPKKLKKFALNQRSIIDRISQGKLKMLEEGSLPEPCLLAGCSCDPQSGCPIHC